MRKEPKSTGEETVSFPVLCLPVGLIHDHDGVGHGQSLLLIVGHIDKGDAGGNFQRPAFQQMISDMENGEIGIIVTKDLSRLGRIRTLRN